jgi:uncharacterized protein
MENSNSSRRFQEPIPPFEYQIEEVNFSNSKAHIVLAGTLTLPRTDKPAPAVVLISGMGPKDRNGMMYGHKMFFVLADFLTRQGIAVLRYDKRGVGKSGGTFDLSVTSEDLAQDARAAFDYLTTRPEINCTQIGLIGHSEGGFIASILAAQPNNIAFIVLMAGAIVNTIPALLEQTAKQLRMDGASVDLITNNNKLLEVVFNIVKSEQNRDVAKAKLNEITKQYFDQLPNGLKEEAAKYPFAFSSAGLDFRIDMYNSAWYRYLLAYNMADMFDSIQIPILALYGTFDFMDPELAFLQLNNAAQKLGNTHCVTKQLSNLNHAFQTCKTGSLAEYNLVDETIAPMAMKIITDWILKQAIKN